MASSGRSRDAQLFPLGYLGSAVQGQDQALLAGPCCAKRDTVKSRAEQQDCNHELRKWTGETEIFFLFLYLPLFFS